MKLKEKQQASPGPAINRLVGTAGVIVLLCLSYYVWQQIHAWHPPPVHIQKAEPRNEHHDSESGKNAIFAEDISYRRHVQVSIRNGFVPIDSGGGVWRGPSAQLSKIRPAGIVREPNYQGGIQFYGQLLLGTYPNKTYYFVYDLIDGPHPVLYFDFNHNNDLSDDGGPLHNQGSGIFAVNIVLPIRQLIKEFLVPGDFSIWFFTNNSLWEREFSTHYSRTRLHGQIMLNDKSYAVRLAEWNVNDADFTNDGIHIDLNGDGKFAWKDEFIKPDQALYIDDIAYLFDVTW